MENLDKTKQEQTTQTGNWKKNTILFLLSQLVSLFGSSLVQYAIIWHITLSTQSGVMMTISTLCGFLPQVLISIFAGVWADRYNKKTLIAVSDSCIAISTLVVAILFLTGIDNIWLLFVALAIRSFGAGVQTPAVNALIPSIVPENQLMRVNGINTTIQSIMLIVSPAVSGALMGLMPIGRLFFIDVITAIIGVGILLFVKVSHKRTVEKGEKIDYWKDIKEGITYIKNYTFLRTFFIFFAILCCCVGPISFLSPLMIARNFGDEVWRLTINEIVFFVGSIAGGIAISVLGESKNKLKMIAFACLLWGILTIAIGISPNFTVFAIIMGLIGVSMPFFNSTSIVILQETVEKSMHGRIFSLVQIVSSGIMPLSMVFYGPLADMLSVEILIILSGVIFLLIALAIIKNKNLKKYNKIMQEKNKEEIQEL